MIVIGAALNIFSKPVLTSLVVGGLLAGLPLMFTALGETISERAGVLNLGLEGMMLLGAYLGFIGAYYLHSAAIGFVFGALGGMVGASFMVVLCVWLGLDQIVVGIAITLAGEGLTSVLQGAQFGTTYPRLGAPSNLAIPLLDKIPILGPSVFNQPLIAYLGFVFAGVLVWAFRATNIGLNLKAAGEKPEALDAAGVSVIATRSWAALATGALAGIGGAYLSVVAAGVFTPFMTQGQGYMAIVIAMLARGRPGWVVAASFLFGISLSIATALQLAGINISTDLINMLPFLTIMVALAIFGVGPTCRPGSRSPTSGGCEDERGALCRERVCPAREPDAAGTGCRPSPHGDPRGPAGAGVGARRVDAQRHRSGSAGGRSGRPFASWPPRSSSRSCHARARSFAA